MNTKHFVLVIVTLISFKLHALDNQELENTLRNLCVPVKTTASGFSDFLRNTYNHAEYSKEVLPNNFTHLLQLLEHGKTTQQSKSYIQSVLHLFTLKLKGCSYVNAHAFNATLPEVVSNLEGYFLVTKSQTMYRMQEKINNLLYARFLEQFSLFKSNPSTFLQDISQDIAQSLCQESDQEEDISAEALRKTTLIFLEVALGKLVWDAQKDVESWDSVKSISYALNALVERNIINDRDDLNGLFVTLLERYSFFIDVSSHQLSNTFYETIINDINSKSLVLLEQEELEPLIESKKDRFSRVITTAFERSSTKIIE